MNTHDDVLSLAGRIYVVLIGNETLTNPSTGDANGMYYEPTRQHYVSMGPRDLAEVADCALDAAEVFFEAAGRRKAKP
jgi:hypothetical protein